MKRKKLQKPILAEGEVTGHCHQLEKDIDVFELGSGEREFTLNKPTRLNHQEHNTVTIPEGEQISDKVIEYDPFLEEAKKVLD